MAFCRTIEEAGYRAGIYFNQSLGYMWFDLSRLDRYVLWLAEYSAAPTFRYHFELWQYSAEGTVAGIDGPVDLNLGFWKKKENQSQ